MTKTILAAAALLSLGAASFAPAFAAEGNGEPFPGASFAQTRLARPATGQFDVGAAQYPNTIGRPGSNLSRLANDQVLPAEGNEQAVQTANSLPSGFEEGTVAFAQAQSMNTWIVAHAARPNYATR